MKPHLDINFIVLLPSAVLPTARRWARKRQKQVKTTALMTMAWLICAINDTGGCDRLQRKHRLHRDRSAARNRLQHGHYYTICSWTIRQTWKSRFLLPSQDHHSRHIMPVQRNSRHIIAQRFWMVAPICFAGGISTAQKQAKASLSDRCRAAARRSPSVAPPPRLRSNCP
ncbi:hypothetical protein N657DRAFT_283014 [Parathielavia appendiculata]|uniref:Uncharacterized protein n=1 Tax=Parathielavia appendiculata TaxID=2587402 RepID=A0AAN6U3U5_9PEZI|nr:hypothetical protein N657DRAFT_283014 [Parathielavia appendiculata]